MIDLPLELDLLFGKDINSKPYNGRISIIEAAELIKKSKENSLELCNDAQLLFENERYARSLSLAILAIEESGKVYSILEILMVDQKFRKACWGAFRDHREKNYTWILPALNDLGYRINKERYLVLTDPHGPFCKIANDLKMLGFYVDVDENRKLIKPSDKVTPDLAEFFLSTAFDIAGQASIWSNSECVSIWASYNVPPGNGKGEVHMFKELAKRGLITEQQATNIINNIKNEPGNEVPK